ncbi:MAG: DUF2330 domain-containing protein, partial [Myxococcales bacterium]|nr:DUF2330 domain-containing protein [Myxococcales bacterium]
MRVLFSALFLLVAATAVARPSHACAPAPPEGAFVDIVSEEALIVFDAAKRQEHFVRRASFHADSKDFGFLVPTPSKPELAEADDAIFDRLRRAIAPEIIRRKKRHLALGACAAMFLAGDKAAAPFEAASAVEVLGRERVAGLDAAILAAKDSDALGRWLDDHGYHFRPELRDWLQAYLDRDYIITAFKIAGDDPRKHATKALRMSFASERPFYPYREPSDQRTKLAAFYQGDPLGPPKRTLRVYLLAAGRWEGALEGGLAWPAEVEYAAPPKKGLDLGPSLPAALLPAGAWLHAFVDRSSPRPGTADL